jgi:hypothetical protein
VQTNDPRQPRVDLTVVGTVKGYLNVSPLNVRLIGTSGKALHQAIHITPDVDHPFSITSVKAKEGKDITFQLKPLGKDPRREGYSLEVRNTRTEKGAYRDYITVETDLKEKPTIHIPVTGNILEAPTKADRKP